jgi:F-type H+-transporting ATPase subunit delta
MHNEERGILEFEMVTAHPIDEHLARNIAGQLKLKFGSDIELRTRTDPSLIGGALIRNKDRVYDASIARQLEMMRDDAIAKTVAQLRQRTEQFATE